MLAENAIDKSKKKTRKKVYSHFEIKTQDFCV